MADVGTSLMRRIEEYQNTVEGMEATFSALLPTDKEKQRFMRIAVNLVGKFPDLIQIDRKSLLDSILFCAELGLEPNTGTGMVDIIPFKGKATAIIGYKGFVQLFYRAGCKDVDAIPIFKGDTFKRSFDSKTNKWRIIYDVDLTAPHTVENLVGVWTKIVLPTGEVRHNFISKSDIEDRVPSNIRSRGVWSSGTENEKIKMYRKTAIRAEVPFVPIIGELGEKLALASASEERAEYYDEPAQPNLLGTAKTAPKQIEQPKQKIAENTFATPEKKEEQESSAEEEYPMPNDDALFPANEVQSKPQPEKKKEHSFRRGDKVYITTDLPTNINDNEKLNGMVTSDEPVNKMYEVKLLNGTINYNGKDYDKFKFFPSKLELMPF